jgi:hypothetical protein
MAALLGIHLDLLNFVNHKHQMKYDKCRTANYPISLGVTEVAHRILHNQHLCQFREGWEEIRTSDPRTAEQSIQGR